MQRIIDGILFESKFSDKAFNVNVWECNGHREVSVRAAMEWAEIGPVPPLDDWPSEEERLADEAERKARSLRKAALRAKTMLRRVIKAEGFNELLTLTYKVNQMDRALCKAHFEKWVRRMKAAIPGFRYAAAFERQERGAMHVHLCTYRLPPSVLVKGVKVKAYEVGTRIWRDVVGALGGMCFVGGRPGSHRKGARMGGAKMAAYVSKYIMKDFEDAPAESNRYSRSNGAPVGNKLAYTVVGTLLDAIVDAQTWHCAQQIVSESVGKFADGYWLCVEPSA